MIDLATARPAWHEEASCRGHPEPWLWFPDWSERHLERSGRTAADYSPLAVLICSDCPAANDCLDWAIRRNVDGIWAATTPTERRNIRRRRHIPLIETPDPTDPHEDHDAA